MLLSFSIEKMLPYVCAGILMLKNIDMAEAYAGCAISGTITDINNSRMKKQTIRHDNGEKSLYRRLKAGKVLHLWWKSRSPKEGIKLGRVECKSVEKIEISINFVRLEDRLLTGNEVKELSYADGFDSITEFFNFFVKDGESFYGFLIKW